MSSVRSTSGGPRAFPATRWSLVTQAHSASGPTAAFALEEICKAYWRPLYSYLRLRGETPHNAEDLVQEFFERMIEGRWLDAADPQKGKLRTFLLCALQNFLHNEWRRAVTQKRGGGLLHVPMNTAFAESTAAASPPESPEQAFDRQWAVTLADRALALLQSDYEQSGNGVQFAALKPSLTTPRGEVDYEALADRLGVSEPATRVALHRLRKRFRDVFREEVGKTLAPGADLEEEIRYLAVVLRSHTV